MIKVENNTFEELGIREEHIINVLILRGEIDLHIAIKYHMKELSFAEVVKSIKYDTRGTTEE